MNTLHRPDRRDWLVGILAGAGLGFVILGMGSRVGMRLFALAARQATSFSIDGSIAVSLLGAVTGAVIALLFLGVRAAFPTRRWVRAALFWIICGALALRGLRPVTLLNAGIFLPLFVAHGMLLHLFWCRVHLARGSRVNARVQP